MKKDKKLGRSLYVVLIGAIFGGIIGSGLPLVNDFITYFTHKYQIDFMIYIVPLLMIVSVLLYLKSKHQYNAMSQPQNKSEDDQYIYQLNQYNKSSKNIVNASNILIMAIALATADFILKRSTQYLIYYAIIVVIFLILVLIYTKHNRTVLLAFPSITNSGFELDYEDRQIMTTLINNIDEGERLVMLHALSKTYIVMIYMLSGLLLLLALYQATSGENQYLAMIGITSVLIYSTIAYYKKSEEFNK